MGAERRAGAVPYLDVRAAVELPRRLEIRAALGGAAAAEEASEDAGGRPGPAGRRPEEVLEDGHREEHGDEDGGGHEPEGHRAHAAVQLPPPHLLRRGRRGSSGGGSPRPRARARRRGHRRTARHGTPLPPFFSRLTVSVHAGVAPLPASRPLATCSFPRRGTSCSPSGFRNRVARVSEWDCGREASERRGRRAPELMKRSRGAARSTGRAILFPLRSKARQALSVRFRGKYKAGQGQHRHFVVTVLRPRLVCARLARSFFFPCVPFFFF